MFTNFYTAEEMLNTARDAGFSDVRHVPAAELNLRYFAGRADGLCLPDLSEEFLLAGA